MEQFDAVPHCCISINDLDGILDHEPSDVDNLIGMLLYYFLSSRNVSNRRFKGFGELSPVEWSIDVTLKNLNFVSWTLDFSALI